MLQQLTRLLARNWWTWEADAPLPDQIYHYGNLCEGVCWIALGVLVLRRWLRQGSGPLEPLYAAAFVAFGATDFQEARALSTWLILAKGVNLAALLALRAVVIRRFYPQSRLY